MVNACKSEPTPQIPQVASPVFCLPGTYHGKGTLKQGIRNSAASVDSTGHQRGCYGDLSWCGWGVAGAISSCGKLRRETFLTRSRPCVDLTSVRVEDGAKWQEKLGRTHMGLLFPGPLGHSCRGMLLSSFRVCVNLSENFIYVYNVIWSFSSLFSPLCHGFP